MNHWPRALLDAEQETDESDAHSRLNLLKLFFFFFTFSLTFGVHVAEKVMMQQS